MVAVDTEVDTAVAVDTCETVAADVTVPNEVTVAVDVAVTVDADVDLDGNGCMASPTSTKIENFDIRRPCLRLCCFPGRWSTNSHEVIRKFPSCKN